MLKSIEIKKYFEFAKRVPNKNANIYHRQS